MWYLNKLLKKIFKDKKEQKKEIKSGFLFKEEQDKRREKIINTPDDFYLK